MAETLVNPIINNPTLNLVNVPVPGGDLLVGDRRFIVADGPFANLFVDNCCNSVGLLTNIARVDATGDPSGIQVSDDDPTYINCMEDGITIKKQVSLTGGEPFFDADDSGDADVPLARVS